MEELSSQDGHETQSISEETKSIIVEQGNIEAFEIMDLTDQIRTMTGTHVIRIVNCRSQ